MDISARPTSKITKEYLAQWQVSWAIDKGIQPKETQDESKAQRQQRKPTRKERKQIRTQKRKSIQDERER